MLYNEPSLLSPVTTVERKGRSPARQRIGRALHPVELGHGQLTSLLAESRLLAELSLVGGVELDPARPACTTTCRHGYFFGEDFGLAVPGERFLPLLLNGAAFLPLKFDSLPLAMVAPFSSLIAAPQ